ncbi:hypothetical protein ElyMa_002299300 [Elysia marginata]|uniref:Uncharacterized protein n=1 Tax=Elysia marginata TaxID=1093978 RepID=A0AAV4G2H9_9GAST|nr:hypothetical protein ElyMa_002299300 [Elysia marginata]
MDSSSPSYVGGALTRDHKEVFQVAYSKNENSVTIDDSQISATVSQEDDRGRRSEPSDHSPIAPPTVHMTR